jgi:heavy metal sensor kinase
MKWLRPKNVRVRLTLWYVGVLGSILLIYSVSASIFAFLQWRSEVDGLAAEEVETIEGFLSFNSEGRVYLRGSAHDHPYPISMQHRLMEVLSDNGAVLYRNEPLGSRDLGGAPFSGEGVNSYSPRSVTLADGTRVRVVSRRHTVEGKPTIIRIGFSEEELWRRLWQLIVGLLAVAPLALAAAGAGGYFLARRALSPIQRMAQRALEINAHQLGARLTVENPDDEIGLLATAFNETLARIESSFQQLRRFTSDASHELRTPLNAIQNVGEVGLRKRGSADEYREVISTMLEESGRLTRLVDNLLTMARADAERPGLALTEIPALEFVKEAASLLEVLAEEKGQILSTDGDESASVLADRMILRHIVINLIDNAIKYSPFGSHIRVRVLENANQSVSIEVEDNGPGIPVQHRSKVFDRFYRIDEARTRETGGAGLGLSIAKWGAEAHGGGLELRCPPAGGCIFGLNLPIRDARPDKRSPRVSLEPQRETEKSANALSISDLPMP